MKKFLIICSIGSARGTQTWEVNAENKHDARAKWLRDEDCIFVDEEIEVTSLHEPEIEEVE